MKKQIKISGAEILMECLTRSDSKIVFGYPGGAIMPIYDTLAKYKNIKHILTGHEQGAVFAAEGYARVKKKPGICFATSGPGATNLITGIADAMLDSTPIICITGQVSRKMLGTEAFQEVPFVEMVKPVTKYAVQIKNANEIFPEFTKAYKIAMSGRPGPVVIDIPKDVQLEKVECDFNNFSVLKDESKVKLDLEKVYKLLNENSKILVLVGQGIKISNTEKLLKKMIKKTNFMFSTTLHGLMNFGGMEHNNFNMLGMHGRYASNKAVCEAEVILAMGMRFDDRVTGDIEKFAKQAKIIHIDIDKSQINKKIKTEIGICSSLENFFHNLDLKRLNRKGIWMDFKNRFDEEEKDRMSKNNKMNMHNATSVINRYFPNNKILVSDVGQHQMVLSRELKLSENDLFISSGGLGSMGYSLPAAIGAYFADSKKTVVSVSGDGGFQMNIQELATVMRNKIPLKIIIFNNSYLGMVRQWQELFFQNNLSQVELENPDFVGIGKAYRIKSFRVKSIKEAERVLEKVSKINRAVLVEFICEKEENVFPMVPAGHGIGEMVFE